MKIDCAATFIFVQRESHEKTMESMSGKFAALKRYMAAPRADYDTFSNKATKDERASHRELER